MNCTSMGWTRLTPGNMLFAGVLLVALSRLDCSNACPPQCLCYEHSDLVDCRARGFLRVPHNLPHGTWLLDFGGNLLTDVRTHAFAGLWSLRVLVLSDSGIQHLQRQVNTHCINCHHNLKRVNDSSSKMRLNLVSKAQQL